MYVTFIRYIVHQEANIDRSICSRCIRVCAASVNRDVVFTKRHAKFIYRVCNDITLLSYLNVVVHNHRSYKHDFNVL